ncbi:MAG: hypothetical protein ACT6XY_22665 [Phreatobacter sp.]|jgi:hypothetical protein|uniref:hypothetical protein n=1 Tax=Phreatobacter sp. TaxID=1966341 RepID=UPI0040352A62
MIRPIALALLLATLTTPSVAATSWVPGNGRPCDQVCQGAGRKPVQTGVYLPNRQMFNICAANTAGEGLRPGFNLRPNWSNVCVTAWGPGTGQARSERQYECLCE